jgi:hypothetical protein
VTKTVRPLLLTSQERLAPDPNIRVMALRQPATRGGGQSRPIPDNLTREPPRHRFDSCRLRNGVAAAAEYSSPEKRFQLQTGTHPISQRVRIARLNILICDEHAIDLYQLIGAPYLMA